MEVMHESTNRTLASNIRMESLLEYNLLMERAGHGKLAEEQQNEHKPQVQSELPADMVDSSDGEKLKFLRNKKYRDTSRKYLMEYRRQKVVCKCGASISKPNIRHHQKSMRCKNRLLENAKVPASFYSALAQSAALQQEREEELLQPPPQPQQPPRS